MHGQNMDYDDCIRLLQETKPQFSQLVKNSCYTKTSFYSWHETKHKLGFVTESSQRFVQFTIIIHVVFITLQIFITTTSQAPKADLVLAFYLVLVTLLTVISRWEFHPDVTIVQMINVFLAGIVKSDQCEYTFSGLCNGM